MNTSIRMKLHAAIYCALGTTALCVLSTSVEAADQDPPTKTVRYSDLNIQTSDGAKTLFGRIRAAAQEVCQILVGNDPILHQAKHACFEKAVDGAVKKVNAPLLTTLRFGSSDVRLASK